MSEIIINEIWKSIDGYLNYQVSNMGRVRNCITGKILKQHLEKDGYYFVVLFKDKERSKRIVHKLVANEFLEQPNDGIKCVIDHKDRDRTNNHLTNLRYVSIQENNMNRGKHGNTSSQYKGVSWQKHRSKWKAGIKVNGKNIHLGVFENEEDAAKAYNEKAFELYGECAYLNKI